MKKLKTHLAALFALLILSYPVTALAEYCLGYEESLQVYSDSISKRDDVSFLNRTYIGKATEGNTLQKIGCNAGQGDKSRLTIDYQPVQNKQFCRLNVAQSTGNYKELNGGGSYFKITPTHPVEHQYPDGRKQPPRYRGYQFIIDASGHYSRSKAGQIFFDSITVVFVDFALSYEELAAAGCTLLPRGKAIVFDNGREYTE
ncbi:hypothetical protein [Colwellia sp. Arc7-D]|uniref:hypothetical protein n=1 Tax=Colwellia sp. Arc7-D TaxID=2161872 RepID=UPI0013A57F16|nr:hypothetical protein [Colwellia sp. Arc7-D]